MLEPLLASHHQARETTVMDCKDHRQQAQCLQSPLQLTLCFPTDQSL